MRLGCCRLGTRSAAQQGDRTQQGCGSPLIRSGVRTSEEEASGAGGGRGEEDIPDGEVTGDRVGTWKEHHQKSEEVQGQGKGLLGTPGRPSGSPARRGCSDARTHPSLLVRVRPLNRGPRGLKGTQSPLARRTLAAESVLLRRPGGSLAERDLERKGMCRGLRSWSLAAPPGSRPGAAPTGAFLSHIPDSHHQPQERLWASEKQVADVSQQWGQWTRFRNTDGDSVCSEAASWRHTDIRQQQEAVTCV